MPKKQQIEQNVKKRGSKTSQNHVYIYNLDIFIAARPTGNSKGISRIYIYIYTYVELTFQSQKLR